jgi:hypothetical protein
MVISPIKFGTLNGDLNAELNLLFRNLKLRIKKIPHIKPAQLENQLAAQLKT